MRSGRGCLICRQRKIKCDLTIPTCLNCRKKRRPCPGYEGIRFQDERPKLEQRYGFTKSEELTASQQCEVGHEGENMDHEESMESNPTDGHSVTSKTSDQGHVNIKAQMLSPVIQQTQLLQVLAHAMSGSDSTSALMVMGAHRRLLSDISVHLESDSLVRNAAQAITVVHLGLAHARNDLVNQARIYYGNSLRLLQLALRDTKNCMTTETLSATVLLSLYERFLSDEFSDWIRHASGVEALLRARGPMCHRYGPARDIYLAYRTILPVEAFANEKSCLLDDPQWRKLGYDVVNDMKQQGRSPGLTRILSLAEDMFAEIVKVPGQVVDAFRYGFGSTSEGVSCDVARVNAIAEAERLQTRISTRFLQLSECLASQGHAPMEYGTHDPVVSVSYRFTDLYTAMLHIQFWSNSIVLSNLIILLDQVSDRVKHYAQLMTDAFLHCLRSVEYMESANILGRFAITFPLKLAVSVDIPMTAEIRLWTLQKIEEVANVNAKPSRQ